MYRLYVESFKKGYNKHIKKTEVTDVENKHGYQRINMGGNTYWETGTDIHTLLYIK